MKNKYSLRHKNFINQSVTSTARHGPAAPHYEVCQARYSAREDCAVHEAIAGSQQSSRSRRPVLGRPPPAFLLGYACRTTAHGSAVPILLRSTKVRGSLSRTKPVPARLENASLSHKYRYAKSTMCSGISQPPPACNLQQMQKRRFRLSFNSTETRRVVGDHSSP